MTTPVEQTPSIEAVVAAVLVAHQRNTAGSCLCGWSELGHSHAGHVTEVLASARLLAAAPVVRDGFTIEAPPVTPGARPKDLEVLLTRAAQVVRRRAAKVSYWYPDAQIDVLACVVVEGRDTVVASDLHPDLASYWSTWDPATAVAVAALLEHAARCIRLDGKVGDHQHAIALARSIMRRAGDAP
ncbi:hypothetical protein [Jiangella alkaliphila]|uniref:Uncharacterized protein n=1 Tax=Jiangella alkaliphila TaxID=419479 RepID=A0A1H2IDG6_9ACTN|nr:hypothetical protein [Jiangella alkaliphila]SDU42220.1 hypothetical protein SAMN04488563_1634 [Jiangella alkaliphila]